MTEPRTDAGRALLLLAAYDGIALVAAESLRDRILAIEAEAGAAPLDVDRLTRTVHNTECGYASHIPDDDGDDPNPCGFRAEVIAAEYARLSEGTDR